MPEGKKTKNLTKMIHERETGKKIDKQEASRASLTSKVEKNKEDIEKLAKQVAGLQVDGDFKKGGKVKKDGVYRLHKGEEVVPVKKKK